MQIYKEKTTDSMSIQATQDSPPYVTSSQQSKKMIMFKSYPDLNYEVNFVSNSNMIIIH